MKPKGIFLLTAVALASALWLASERPVNAESDPILGVGIGHRLAGTYYTQEWPSAAGPVAVVWTITASGNIVSDTGVDQGATGLIWGNVRGSWVQAGPRTIECTSLGLGFDPAAGGAHVWTLKVHAVFHFAPDFQSASAEQYNELYLAGQNPLDPDEEPFWAGELPPYEFQRVNVE